MQFALRFLILLSISAITLADEDLSDAINSFTLEFYQKAAKVDPDKNLITSPLSIQDVLGLLAHGARGNSQKQIIDTLRMKDLNSIAGRVKSMVATMNSNDSKSGILKFANKIYVRDNPALVLNSEFEKTAIDAFSSEIEKIDFSDVNETANTINKWIEDKTNDKIKKFIERLDPSTVACLINAIYFKGNWLYPFKPENVKSGMFKRSPNVKIPVEMMHQWARFNYGFIPELNSQILSLPYTMDNTELIIILPEETYGLEELEKKINTINVTNLKSKMLNSYLRTTIPKFKIESEINLIDLLSNMGIKDIFDSGKSNLKGLFEGSGLSLYVNYAKQKAFIEVNEEGSEASVATVIGIVPYSMPPVFDANHPFMFLLVKDNSILFCGRYVGA